MIKCHCELTSESIFAPNGERVYRIRATRDIPERHVRAGELGGFVSSLHTADGKLRIGLKAWVAGDAIVSGEARVVGNALVYDHAHIGGHAHITGHARVYGDARVCDHARVRGHARVSDEVVVSGKACVEGNAVIAGQADVSDNAWVGQNAVIKGTSFIYEDAVVTGDALLERSHVYGQARVAGEARLYSGSSVCDSAQVTGTARVFGTTVRDEAKITDGTIVNCWIEGRAHVEATIPDKADLSGEAQILVPEHCEVFRPVGGNDCMVTVARTVHGEAKAWVSTFETEQGWGETVEELERHLDAQGVAEPFRESLSIAKRRVLRESAEEPDEELCFELTDEKRVLDDGTTVFRIRSLCDHDLLWVSKGDLGGWVPSTHSPQGKPRISGQSWLGDDAMILGNGSITSHSFVGESACIKDQAHISRSRVVGEVVVSGDSRIEGSCIYGCGELAGQSWVNAEGTLEITGTIFDGWITSFTDHRRFGPTSTGLLVCATRQKNGKAHFTARVDGTERIGSLHELLATDDDEVQVLRRLITTVLKEWDL